MKFSHILIKWYEANKRDLPWRHTTDPYKVWLSEIILQQTRVDQGMAYYFKFVALFPTVYYLATASEDEVLKAWQGLGYYSRARNLVVTSRQIVDEFKGQFPKTRIDLLKLKGIGAYTSAAIASFCYNERAAAVDGNVSRVLSRIFGIEEPIDSTLGKSVIQKLADDLIDPKRPGIFNQAIMEFGAMQCTPKSPDCEQCPFLAQCFAFKNNRIKNLPAKQKKTELREVFLSYFFLQFKDKTYLRRRSDKGIWKGLYDFPGLESDVRLPHPILTERVEAEFGLDKNFAVDKVSEEYVHLLTHRRIYATFYSVLLHKKWRNPPEGIIEISLGDIENYGVPRLIEKFLDKQKS